MNEVASAEIKTIDKATTGNEQQELTAAKFKQSLDEILPPEVSDKFFSRVQNTADLIAATVPSEYKQSTKTMDRYGKAYVATEGVYLAAMMAVAVDLNITVEQFNLLLLGTTAGPVFEEAIFRGVPADFLVTLAKKLDTSKGPLGRLASNILFGAGHTPWNSQQLDNTIPVNNMFENASDFTKLVARFSSIPLPMINETIMAGFFTRLAGEDGIKRSIIAHSVWNSIVFGMYFTNELIKKRAPQYSDAFLNSSLLTSSVLTLAVLIEGIRSTKEDLIIQDYIDGVRMADRLSDLKEPVGKLNVLAEKLLTSRSNSGYKFKQGAALASLIARLEVAEYTRPGEFQKTEAERVFTKRIITTAPEGLSENQLLDRIDHALKSGGFRKTEIAGFKDRAIFKFHWLATKCASLDELKNKGVDPDYALQSAKKILRIDSNTFSGVAKLALLTPLSKNDFPEDIALKLIKRICELKAEQLELSPDDKKQWIREQFFREFEDATPPELTKERILNRAKYANKLLGT